MTRPVPYPADTRAKGWRFELDHERIEQSDTWALAPADVRPWLLMLWLTAWRQEPCGSLPNDDELIAAKIGMPLKAFAKVRSKLMRGWWEAEDGRLYHDTIVLRVKEMAGVRDKTASRKRLYDQKFDRIRDRDGCACVYCGAKTYLSLDHLIAVSRGGSGEDSNLVTACRRCNSVKGARTPDEAGLTFINRDAERIWHDIRASFSAFGTPEERIRNTLPTRPERENDDTGTGTGTGTGLEERNPPPRSTAGLVGVGGQSPTKAGEVCRAIKAKKVADVSPSNPELLALIAKGVPVETFEAAAEICAKSTPPKGFNYLLGIVRRQLGEAAAIAAGVGMPQKPWDDSRTTIEAKGEELGLGRWDEHDLSASRETFAQYTARVRRAVEQRQGEPA